MWSLLLASYSLIWIPPIDVGDGDDDDGRRGLSAPPSMVIFSRLASLASIWKEFDRLATELRLRRRRRRRLRWGAIRANVFSSGTFLKIAIANAHIHVMVMGCVVGFGDKKMTMIFEARVAMPDQIFFFVGLFAGR